MNSKGVAVLLTAIVILSSLFFFFHVTIPNHAVTPPPVKGVKTPLDLPFFENQTISPSILNVSGANALNFSFSGNVTTKINGVLKNSSNGQPISGLVAWISLYPAAAQYQISSQGYYAFYALRGGNGLFLIKVPGYNEKVVTLDLSGKTIWLNLSLTPASKYVVSGQTVYSNGTIAPDVGITFTGYFSVYSTNSSQTGDFSENMYNDSYLITVSKQNVNPQPDPYIVNVSGISIHGFTLTLYLENVTYNVSGWITNANGTFLSAATVYSPNDNATDLTNSTGYYVISVPKGYNTIVASKTNYMPNQTIIFDTQDMTDVNLTLYNLNPYSYNASGTLIGGNEYNSSQYLNNSSSKVNYSKNSTYELWGYINTTGSGLPVAYTVVNFIINVNGSYFREWAYTTLNGSYSIGFAYPGTYTILVVTGYYEKKVFNVTISSPVTKKDFTLTPLDQYQYTVHGTITNYYSGFPIQGASVFARLYGSSQYAIFNVTNASGNYSITLPVSNYTLYAVASGYQANETALFYLSQNMTINITLKPLGGSNQIWNGSNETIPGQNTSSVEQNLSNAGNYSSSALYNTSIQFFNSSSTGYAANTTFLIIYRIQGSDYYLIAESNETGVVHLGNLENGNYSFFVQSISYEAKAFMLNITQNSTYRENLTPRYFIDLNVTLGNSIVPYGGNRSVPVQRFSITNSILPIPIYAVQELNGTNYSMRAWNGTFNLSYYNSSYTRWNNSTIITGSPVSLNANVSPIGAVINYNASTSWYYRSSFNSTAVLVSAGNGSVLVKLQYGLNNVSVNLSNSSHSYLHNFTLSVSSPIKELYLNVSQHSDSVNLSSYYSPLNGTTRYYTYNGTIPLGCEIYAANISFNIGSDSQIFISGQNESYTYQSYSTQTGSYSIAQFNSLFYTSGSSLYVQINTPITVKGTLDPLQVYYYAVNFT